MSLKGFLQSLKNIFWFGSVSEDLKRKPLSETAERDIFFIARDVEGYEKELEDLSNWFEDLFDETHIQIDDPGETEPYMLKYMEIDTERGSFRIIYYENYELILRGDRELVLEVSDPIANQLDIDFQRI
ncbi:hypothetical protein KGY64_07060 [Candidatus Bipolaricaulota bacterium]|nr:hypothetical protein [Candidatus Bipolaricaulota bacterium]